MPQALARKLRVEAHIGLRNAVRQRRRSAFAAGAVALGVIALVLAGGFIEWIFWAVREGTIQSGLGHVQIVRPGFFAAGAADPMRFLIPERGPEREAIERQRGVRVIAPKLSFTGVIGHGDATLTFVGEAVDPAAEARFAAVGSLVTRGEPLSAAAPDGIIVGRGLAEQLGVAPGDRVVLLVTVGAGGVNAAEATVRGIFSTVSKAYDDSAIRVPLALAQPLLRVSGVHRWVVVLDDTDDTSRFLALARAAIAGKDLEAVPWTDLAEYYRKSVALLSRQLVVVNLIIGVIIVLTISNTLTMSVMERTGEIGTSLALGVSRASVLRQFLFEGVAFGVIGGLAGAAIGIALAKLVSAIGIPMPPPPGGAEAYLGRILVTAGTTAGAVLLALATTLLASLYPAWKASRLVITDALRHNR